MRLLVNGENFVVFLYLWSTVANVAHEVLGRLHAWSAIALQNLPTSRIDKDTSMPVSLLTKVV